MVNLNYYASVKFVVIAIAVGCMYRRQLPINLEYLDDGKASAREKISRMCFRLKTVILSIFHLSMAQFVRFLISH